MDLKVGEDPQKKALGLVTAAFNSRHPRAKTLRRVLHYVLDLAQDRGYRYADQFRQQFMAEAVGSFAVKEKLLNQLFEYVSADELLELAGPHS